MGRQQLCRLDETHKGFTAVQATEVERLASSDIFTRLSGRRMEGKLWWTRHDRHNGDDLESSAVTGSKPLFLAKLTDANQLHIIRAISPQAVLSDIMSLVWSWAFACGISNSYLATSTRTRLWTLISKLVHLRLVAALGTMRARMPRWLRVCWFLQWYKHSTSAIPWRVLIFKSRENDAWSSGWMMQPSCLTTYRDGAIPFFFYSILVLWASYWTFFGVQSNGVFSEWSSWGVNCYRRKK